MAPFGFGKGKKNDGSEPKAKKQKRFGKKKNQETLVERMRLEESVAGASVDVLSYWVGQNDSAVRETDDGFVIVAITNDMLDAAGLDPESEEFGAFAEALAQETVESITLASDLEQGIIGIIPSSATLQALDEFDFVQDLAFQWALVPFDLDDGHQLILLENTVGIGRLMELAGDPDTTLTVKNSAVVFEGGAPAPVAQAASVAYDDDEVEDEEVEDEFGDEFGEEYPDDDFPEEAPLDDEPSFDDEYSTEDYGDEEELDLDAELDELELDDEMPLDDEPGYEAPLEDELDAEDVATAVNRVAEHGFANTELELVVDLTAFDQYFDEVPIAQFDTARTDDSELQHGVSQLRRDANTEIHRFHQDSIQSLRNQFLTNMRTIHNKLVESLDHKSEDTTYGETYATIEATYSDSLRNIDRLTAQEIAEIKKIYDEEREEFGENAKREAYALYDSRHKAERDRKVSAVRENLTTDITTNRDIALGELYEDRRIVARRLFDKAQTAVLQSLQDAYVGIAEKELQMYDMFRKDMDVFTRRHYADEVLRAKAKAEELRQSHEADAVRKEYQQMLATKQAQLDEADAHVRTSIRQLEETHREQLEATRKDYDRRIEREKRDNDELRMLLQEANSATTKIGEQKDKEVESTITTLQNIIKSKDLELQYANQRATQSKSPVKWYIAATAAVCIAIGIMFGFLYGAGSVQQLAPTPPTAETPTTSYVVPTVDAPYGYAPDVA